MIPSIENREKNHFRLCKNCVHEEKQYEQEPCDTCFQDVRKWKQGFELKPRVIDQNVSL